MKIIGCDNEKKFALEERRKHPRLKDLFVTTDQIVVSCPCPLGCSNDEDERCVFDLVLFNMGNGMGVRIVDGKGVDWVRDIMDSSLGYMCMSCLEFIFGGGHSGAEQYVYLSDCNISLCFTCINKALAGMKVIPLRNQLRKEYAAFAKLIKSNNTIRVKNSNNVEFSADENPEIFGIQLSEHDYLEKRKSELVNDINKSNRVLFSWDGLRKENGIDAFKKDLFVRKGHILKPQRKRRSKNINKNNTNNDGTVPTASETLNNNNNKKRSRDELN
eukprot:532538_1